MSSIEHDEIAVEALHSAAVQMRARLDHEKKAGNQSPEWLQGYQEAIYSVNHIFGSLEASIFRRKRTVAKGAGE